MKTRISALERATVLLLLFLSLLGMLLQRDRTAHQEVLIDASSATVELASAPVDERFCDVPQYRAGPLESPPLGQLPVERLPDGGVA